MFHMGVTEEGGTPKEHIYFPTIPQEREGHDSPLVSALLRVFPSTPSSPTEAHNRWSTGQHEQHLFGPLRNHELGPADVPTPIVAQDNDGPHALPSSFRSWMTKRADPPPPDKWSGAPSSPPPPPPVKMTDRGGLNDSAWLVAVGLLVVLFLLLVMVILFGNLHTFRRSDSVATLCSCSNRHDGSRCHKDRRNKARGEGLGDVGTTSHRVADGASLNFDTRRKGTRGSSEIRSPSQLSVGITHRSDEDTVAFSHRALVSGVPRNDPDSQGIGVVPEQEYDTLGRSYAGVVVTIDDARDERPMPAAARGTAVEATPRGDTSDAAAAASGEAADVASTVGLGVSAPRSGASSTVSSPPPSPSSSPAAPSSKLLLATETREPHKNLLSRGHRKTASLFKLEKDAATNGELDHQSHHDAPGMQYNGEWAASTSYHRNSVVRYANCSWLSLVGYNQNRVPSDHATDWGLMACDGKCLVTETGQLTVPEDRQANSVIGSRKLVVASNGHAAAWLYSTSTQAVFTSFTNVRWDVSGSLDDSCWVYDSTTASLIAQQDGTYSVTYEVLLTADGMSRTACVRAALDNKEWVGTALTLAFQSIWSREVWRHTFVLTVIAGQHLSIQHAANEKNKVQMAAGRAIAGETPIAASLHILCL